MPYRNIKYIATTIVLFFLAPQGHVGVAATSDSYVSEQIEAALAALEKGEHWTAMAEAESALDDLGSPPDRWGKARALALLGVLATRAELFSRALQAYEDSYSALESLGDRFGASSVLVAQGEARRLFEQPAEALALLDKALDRIDDINKSPIGLELRSLEIFGTLQGIDLKVQRWRRFLNSAQPFVVQMLETHARRRRAAALVDLGRHEEALGELQHALELSAGLLGFFDAEILLELALIAETLERWEDADRRYQLAQDAAARFGQRDLQASALRRRARLLSARGFFEEALRPLERWLLLAERSGGRRERAMVLNDLGWQLSVLDRHKEALHRFDEALAFAEQLAVPDSGLTSTILDSLATSYLLLGRPGRAEPLLERSLDLARQLGDPQRLAIAHYHLGRLAHWRTRGDDAVSQFQKVVELARRVNSGYLEASGLQSLASVHAMAGRYQEALRFQSRALELAREMGDSSGQAASRINLSMLYANLGQLDLARSQAKRARSLAATLGNRALLKAASDTLAIIHLLTGQHEQALKQFEISLQGARSSGDVAALVEALGAIAVTQIILGRPEAALPRLREAVDRAHASESPDLLASTHLVRALALWRLERLGEAELELKTAVEIFEVSGIEHSYALGLAGLGALSWKADRPDDALLHLRTSAELLESLQRELKAAGLVTSFAGYSPRAVYDLLVEVAVEQGRPDDAFAYAERTKARAFLDDLGNPRSTLGSRDRKRLGELMSVRQQITLLEWQLREDRTLDVVGGLAGDFAGGERQLRQLHRTYRSLRLELERSDPAIAARRRIEPVSLGSAQIHLGPDQSLVAYYVLDQEVLAWVVDHESKHLKRLPISRTELRRRVRLLHRQLSEREFDLETAAWLHRQLISPLEPFLRHQRLLIVPHDVLHLVPFAGLRAAAGDRYLSERFTLGLLPSASALPVLVERRTAGGGRPLVLGDPDGSLPEAAAEAATVAAFLGTEAHLGAEARESRLTVASGDLDVLHLATHGVVDSADFLFSYLKLAPGHGLDGRLETQEILDLELSGTRLVVLSACGAGQGQLTHGDEFLGMVRAFLVAGSAAVISPLWAVDDAAGRALMAAFYTALGDGHDPSSALRQAQLALRAGGEWESPYFWASFTFTGDPGGFAP